MPRKDATTSFPSAARVASEFSSAGRLTTRMRRLSTMSRMSISPLSAQKI